MKPKNKRSIFDNKRSLMLISILLALLSWIMIAGFINPGRDTSVSSKIDFTRTAASYRNRDLQIVNYPENQQVTINISGNMNIIATLRSSDFLIYADFSNVSGPGIVEVPLRIEPYSDNFEVVTWGIGKDLVRTIEVEFEPIVTKFFKITPVIDGITPAEGFFIDTIMLSQNQSIVQEVEISGPESEMAKIALVTAVVEDEIVADASQTFNDVKLKILDEENKELQLQHVQIINGDEVDVQAPVLKAGELKLTVGFVGTQSDFDDEWLQSLMRISPETLRVGGQAGVMDNLPQSYEIGTVDVSTITVASGKEFIIPIELPQSLKNRDQLKEAVVTFDTGKLVVKTFESIDIRVSNSPSNLNVIPVDDSVRNIVIMGLEEDITALLQEDIIVQVDALGMSTSRVGRQTLPARIVVARSNKVLVLGTYTVICDVELN